MKKFEKFLISAVTIAVTIAAKGMFILFTVMFVIIAICALVTVFTGDAGDCILSLLGAAASGVAAYVNYSMI